MNKQFYQCDYNTAMSAGKMVEHLKRMGVEKYVIMRDIDDGTWFVQAYDITREERERIRKFDRYLVSKEEAAA